ncbi:hypothetical protein ACFL35_15500, partial [Candidatus Riflebacteria bacterium]
MKRFEPVWNNATIYPSIESAEIKKDLKKISRSLAILTKLSSKLTSALKGKQLRKKNELEILEIVTDVFLHYSKILPIVWDFHIYLSAECWQNSGREVVTNLLLKAENFLAELAKARVPIQNFIISCNMQQFKQFLQHKKIKPYAIELKMERKKRRF